MNSYIEFLQYCLEDNKKIPESACTIDWNAYLEWADQQAIVGVCYRGIENQQTSDFRIPFDILMKWIGYAQQITVRNRRLNLSCEKTVREYIEAGYDCILLKGQGNAEMYPDPLTRTPGDIDLLIIDANRNELVKYVETRHQIEDIRHHHIEYREEDVVIEIHTIPCQMNNLFYHRRLQKWLRDVLRSSIQRVSFREDGGMKIPVPNWKYNVVFQLAHMMHHFFDEGIGLRQFIDYYYLLKKKENTFDDIVTTLKSLNLFYFACAVMYVEMLILGLDQKYLIAPVDERRGKTLLEEILKGGNFGTNSGIKNHSICGKYLAKTWRNLHFVIEYPSEALCEPIFRTWHFFWRLFLKFKT